MASKISVLRSLRFKILVIIFSGLVVITGILYYFQYFKKGHTLTISTITLIGLSVFLFIDRMIVQRLKELSRAVERFSGGNFEERAEVKGEDEVGKLARAFNTMAHQLRVSITQTEGYSRTLEEKVQESRAIMEIQREILQELDLERLLPLIIRRASELIGAQSGAIYLYDEHHKVCRPRAWYNLGEWIRNVEIPLGKGVTGTSALEKRGIIANVYPNSPYAIPAFIEHPIQAAIAQPLIIKDKVIGVITINDANIGRTFSQDDLELLGLFANQASIAIENARLYEKELKRTQELFGLIKAGQAVTSTLNLDDVLRSIVILAAQVMGVSTCVLMLLDEKGEELICRAQIGLPEEWVRYERHRVGVGLSGLVASQGRPLSVLDMASDSRYVHQDMARKYGFLSYLGVPVKAKERLIGVLSILTKRARSFIEDEIGLLSTFADQAAIAIENARLFESELNLLREIQERRRLEEISRIRSEFIAHVSHELRTPLNAIIGFSELLQDKTFGELNERQSRYIHNIYESGRHLLSVINDILDISKVEAGKIELHPERFSLTEALDAALRIVQPQARKKGLSLELEVDPSLSVIKADPVRFKQIMYNLLSNAVKFTPEGGQVRIAAHLVHGSQFTVDGKLEKIREPSTVNRERLQDFVEILVSDTGIGINPEDQGKLFKEFVQIDSPYARKYKGTGLGLALTKRLVEMHQGKIWAESGGEGMGSKFTFILPLSSGSDQYINL